jgi:putative nucleotidyltransferase with HDIG domain
MIIKDEIHGTIGFDGLEAKVIDCPTYQRLRRIKQMSVTNLVYPGANHTRFEHSLGTAHLSALIARKVGLEEEDIRKVKLYGLLHDIGHSAFSHEGEDVVKRYIGDHEKRGIERIAKGELADIISENFRPKEIADVARSPYGSIITSDLGSDRMDYLKRDALNTGVAYGIIDMDRIVHTLMMDKGQLCIGKGGLEAAEYLLVARFMMFSAVYMHRTVRIATAMLYRAIEGSIEDGTIEPKEFADMDDESAFARMRCSRLGGRYTNALIDRQLYKEVCSFPKEGWTEAKARKLEGELKERIGADILVDHPHQFFKPIELKVEMEGRLQPINRLSKLVQSLKNAEEGRMRVLVLAEEGVKEREGGAIRKACGSR